MWNRLKSHRIEGSGRLWLIATVALLEAALIGYLWVQSAPKLRLAYLMKVGPQYVLASVGEDTQYETFVFSNLKDALSNIKAWGMIPGRNTTDSVDIEYLSFSDRPSGYVVHWKTFDQTFLNQLTFHSHSEARYFLESIRTGSYSVSPFGHSLLFYPQP